MEQTRCGYNNGKECKLLAEDNQAIARIKQTLATPTLF